MFSVMLNSSVIKFEFKVELLPNDLNLAHLSDKVSFNNLPEINIFVKFVDCVKKGNVLQTDGQ